MNQLQRIRLAMVNNPKRSDVVFLVGQENPVKVYANSPTLMMHSEVFDSMFSGDFEMAAEIRVTDMKSDIFLEILKFIYAGASAITLTTANMLGLLYGAQKYMIQGLKLICEDFVLAHTNNTNLLEVFDASQFFENSGKLCY
jgi:hypothetical protein